MLSSLNFSPEMVARSTAARTVTCMMYFTAVLFLYSLLSGDLDLALTLIARENNASAHGTRYRESLLRAQLTYALAWVRARG